MADGRAMTALGEPVGTRRYVVRGVESTDLDDLFDVHRDDEVTAFLPYDTWRSIDDGHAWLARVRGLEAAGGARQLVVVDRSTGRAIGAIVLFHLDAGSRRVEIGYVLGRKSWGRGVMSEVLPLVIDRAFTVLDLRRIEAFADAENVASDRLLKQLDFVHEGTMRARDEIKGRVRDASVYGLLKQEWRGIAGDL